ncbi:hypothetical protein [Actinoplanes sp. NPDC049681]|uniref:hypothetical protein n=1 Tax=Actinoplanes sp. NPDC049681 TaxID=3363905 RepID=UPI0037AA1D2D
MSEPLPTEQLGCRRLVVSMSDSPDLQRLGLTDTHINLVLGEVARAVLIAGGSLAYGGDLRIGGFTEYLMSEVQRYGPLDYPALLIALAWQNHREMTLSDLEEKRRYIEDFADVVFLDPHGNEVEPEEGRGGGPAAVDDRDRAPALTAMRRFLESKADARLAIGGKREGFQGRMPGLMEELLFALEGGKPLYLAGGFGGATMDVARLLGAGDTAWFPPLPPPADARYAQGLTLIADVARRPGWSLSDNGLDREQNDRLIATPRPSEIAGLVTLGLHRRLHR